MQMYHGTRPTKFGHRGYEYADTGEPVPPEIELTTRPEGGPEAAESPEHTNYLIQFSFVMDGRLASVTFLPIPINSTVRVSEQAWFRTRPPSASQWSV